MSQRNECALNLASKLAEFLVIHPLCPVEGIHDFSER